MLGPSAEALLFAGARWTPYILERGQWWRLITAMFLHAGIIHFITNAIAQIMICSVIEIRYGTIVTAIVYILSGISGNVWSSIFIPQYLGVGASGALFGIIGVWVVEIFKQFSILAHPWITIITTISILLCTFAFGLLPFVDNYAHLGN